jgi:hypothetical protein
MKREQFVQAMSRADFVKQFGKAFLERGYFVRFIAFFGNLVPNIGPLKRLPFKPLPDNLKQFYFRAYRNASTSILRKSRPQRGEGCCFLTSSWTLGSQLALEHTRPPNKAYAELLDHHTQDHFAHMPKELADDMLSHFRDRYAALRFEDNQREREKIVQELNEFEAAVQ